MGLCLASVKLSENHMVEGMDKDGRQREWNVRKRHGFEQIYKINRALTNSSEIRVPSSEILPIRTVITVIMRLRNGPFTIRMGMRKTFTHSASA